MRIFGFIIPIAYFRRQFIDNTGFPVDDQTDWETDIFEIAWLGWSVGLFTTNVRPVKTKETI